MNSGRRVLFYVQHLLGIGHLKRAATLARAMAAEGLAVTVVSGGMPLEILDPRGFDLVQLAPLRAGDRSFVSLVDADGAEPDEALKAGRRAQLLDTFDRLRPLVLLIELYPFGRRQLGFEIGPLIEAARAMMPRPVIASSVRDVLVEKRRPERAAEMAAAARAQFDHILVHGDPHFIPFEETFEPAGQLRDMIHYTGYVVDGAPGDEARGEAGSGEVIVSAGGGATGEKLLRTALAARGLSILRGAPWRLLCGPNLDERAFDALTREAGAGVTVERARADFTSLLANCRLSISQCGYNTMMEVLSSGAPAIAVPYAGGWETEQTLRARLLAGRGLISALDEDALSPEVLARAIEGALSRPPASRGAPDMDGAGASARLIAGWAGGVAGSAQ